jgi:hypothetical protein
MNCTSKLAEQRVKMLIELKYDKVEICVRVKIIHF